MLDQFSNTGWLQCWTFRRQPSSGQTSGNATGGMWASDSRDVFKYVQLSLRMHTLDHADLKNLYAVLCYAYGDTCGVVTEVQYTRQSAHILTEFFYVNVPVTQFLSLCVL